MIDFLCLALSFLCSFELAKSKGIHLNKYDGNNNLEFLNELTTQLGKVHRFDSFVIFSQEKFARFHPIVANDQVKFAHGRSLEQALAEDFQIPILTLGCESTAKLRNIIGQKNLAFVQLNNFTDHILKAVDYTLEGLHFMPIIFFYKGIRTAPPTLNEMSKFFNWCWSKNMLNVLLTFQVINDANGSVLNVKNYAYSFSPFPEFEVKNLTDDIRYGNVTFITKYVDDVRGFVFKTPMLANLPYAFEVNGKRNCTMPDDCPVKLSGITGRPYSEYVRQIKGKIQLENFKWTGSQNYNEIFYFGAAKKLYAFGLTPISTGITFYNPVAGSYPLMQSNACIIVPLKEHMHKGHYYWCTFEPRVWAVMPLVFILLIILNFTLKYFDKDLSGMRFQILVTAIFAAFGILLSQPMNIKVQGKRNVLFVLLNALILLLNFILSSLYTAAFTSMLTSTKLHKEIDTIADFLATDLEILGSKNDFEIFFQTKMFREELLPRMRVVDNVFLNQHRRFLNTSFAYIFRAEQWEMGNYQQKRLNRPLFRVPSHELCTRKFYMNIPVQWDSPFLGSLNLFLKITQEVGLASKWQEMAYYDAQEMKLIDFKKPHELPWQPLTLTDFMAAMEFYVYLVILPIVCFLCELLWYHRGIISRKKIAVQ